ncbi:hypothetical protein HQ520_06605 [bacterium]|nr:hypothetical protein [bacterium]
MTTRIPTIMLSAIWALLLLSAPSSSAGDEAASSDHVYLWVSPESFPICGTWALSRYEGRSVLLGAWEKPADGTRPALVGVEVLRDGEYTLWVCSRQFGDSRAFSITVNDQKNKNALGKSAEQGFVWENAGTFPVSAGQAVIDLDDIDFRMARISKILLTDDPQYVPQGTGKAENAQTIPPEYEATYRENNDEWFFRRVQQIENSDLVADEKIVLQNENYSLSFAPCEVSGKNVYLPILRDKHSRVLNDPKSGYFVFLFDREDKASFRPWTDEMTTFPSFDTEVNVVLGGISRPARLTTKNPYISYETKIYFYPEKVVKQDAEAITFATDSKHFTARITYSLKDQYPKVEVSFSPKETGYMTCGAYFFTPLTKEETTYIQLPMRYYAKVLPHDVLIASSASASAPLALIEKGNSSYALVGNLADENFRELSYNQSFAGFAIYNEHKMLQPGVFYPLPAADNARVEKGDSRRFSFFLYAAKKKWNEAFFDIAADILRVTDYRQNYQVTLNDTIYNLTDLVMNDQYGGWVPDHKGWVQIEHKNTVTRSSPLTLYELYYLTGDEEVYEKRVVPTLEYAFSRSNTHALTDPTNKKKREQFPFEIGPLYYYGASIYNGFDKMSQGRNPYVYYDGLNVHDIWKERGTEFHLVWWADSLAAYQLNGDRRYLKAAEEAADEIIRDQIEKPVTENTEPSFMKPRKPQQYLFAFLDLYEETKEERYLNAAKICGDLMCTSIFTHPIPWTREQTYTTDEEMLIKGAHHLSALYYLGKRHLLGYDLSDYDAGKYEFWGIKNPLNFLIDKSALETITVPAWVVSRSGMGIEGIGSLMPRPLRAVENPPYNDLPFRTISNNGECAYLMRLYGYTKERHYWDYSRNQIIGRSANYPGYYVPLFTTRNMRADYPYKGPDVSLIYFHHIPTHLAFTIDFLITSAIVRSGFEIDFPSVTQRGYAWFINRMYGFKPGRFFGDTGVFPILKRDLISLDSIACNYLTAYNEDNFYVYLMNEKDEPVEVKVSLNKAMLDIRNPEGALQINTAGAFEPRQMRERAFTVGLGPKGTAAVKIPGVKVANMPIPAKQAPPVTRDRKGFIRIEDPALGTDIQAVLIAHPLEDKYHAFINTMVDTEEELEFHYRVGNREWKTRTDNTFPYEVTIPIQGLDKGFEFYIVRKSNGAKSKTYSLKLNSRP